MHRGPFTNNSWVPQYEGTECHSTVTSNSTPSPLNYTELPIIATRNVSIQTEESFFSGELVQILKDSSDQSLGTLPPAIILPLKKRNVNLEENCVTEPTKKFPRTDLNIDYLDCLSSHGLQMKNHEFNLESEDQHSNRSHEKHKAGKFNFQETPTYLNQHYAKQSSVDTIEEPLDLSLNYNRTNEHKNDQKTLQGLDLPLPGSNLLSSSVDAPQGSVRSDVEMDESQNNEKVQQEDSLSRQTLIYNRQELSACPLLDDSNHEAETHTLSVELSFLLEELKSSIAIDSLISNSPSLYSELDLKCGKLQGNDAEVLETSSADNAAGKQTNLSQNPSAADRDSLKKLSDDGLEEEDKCCVEEMQSGIEKTNTEYIALEETLDGNSRFLQPVPRVRNLQRKKPEVTVDHFSLSFTRLPRGEQMKIDPERAMKLRKENNRACRKNRVKKAQKIMQLEKELTRFKEIAHRSNASVKC